MVIGLVAVLLFFASWLGEKKENPEKLPAYIGSLHRALNGEYIYRSIPRPDSGRQAASH